MARRFRKIGLLGKLGIRKVNVPSLSGLTRAQAKQELESKENYITNIIINF